MIDLPQKTLFEQLKSLFIKEKKIDCIVFDGKKMNYLQLTQTQIDIIKRDKKYKDWHITINESKKG